MNGQKGFTPSKIGITARESRRVPEKHEERPPLCDLWQNETQTDIRQRRRSFLTGFTLIELLVVIAIIALLMPILMPALQPIKKQAQIIRPGPGPQPAAPGRLG